MIVPVGSSVLPTVKVLVDIPVVLVADGLTMEFSKKYFSFL